MVLAEDQPLCIRLEFRRPQVRPRGKKFRAPRETGHHGFGSEVIRNNRSVRPSKSAMRFQRAAQRRTGLTPAAMDNTDTPVVKINAKWSPKNVYAIYGKALRLDDFVKR